MVNIIMRQALWYSEQLLCYLFIASLKMCFGIEVLNLMIVFSQIAVSSMLVR